MLSRMVQLIQPPKRPSRFGSQPATGSYGRPVLHASPRLKKEPPKQVPPIPPRTPRSKLIQDLFRKKRWLVSGLVSLAVITIVSVIIWPEKSLSESELEYFQQQISLIRQHNTVVETETQRKTEQALMQNNIDAYQEALLEGLAVCEQVQGHIDNTDKAILAPYMSSISQFRQFCRDYEEVVDYARKVSKATKQFMSIPKQSITDDRGTGLTDLQEILGYTRTDLEKLKSNPMADPAREEMITAINSLQNQTKQAIANPSGGARQSLAEKVEKQKASFIATRTYFWNNTIRLQSLSKAIVRVQKLFDIKE